MHKNETIVHSPESTSRVCWICYDNSSNPSCSNDWIEPCRCIGSTRWVHHHCLSQWIDRAANAGVTITNEDNEAGIFSLLPSALRRVPVCSQCKTQYIIQTKQHPFLFALEYARFLYNRVLLLTSAVAGASCIYLITFSYGYAVCIAVYGAEEFADLFRFYLSSDSPLVQYSSEQFVDSWSRSVEFARGAFLARCLTGIPIIPMAMLSASYRFMHWLYPSIPLIMLFGDRQLSFEWPISERLMVSLLPILLKGYRLLRRQLEIYLVKRILKDVLASGLEQIERNLGIDAANLETFVRETESPFSASPLNTQADYFPEFVQESEEHEGQPSGIARPANQNNQEDDSDSDSEDDVTLMNHFRRIADTLLVPFVGSALGRIIFRQSTHIKSKFYRSLVGIGIFILVTDAGYMLAKYWKYKARLSRRILDFPKLLQ